MWTCKKCAASVPADFDVCWKCYTPCESGGSGTTNLDNAACTCPKCQSGRMMAISDADLSFGESGNGESPQKLHVGKAGFFSIALTLSTHVCADCGYVEQRVHSEDAREKLWRIFGEREEE